MDIENEAAASPYLESLRRVIPPFWVVGLLVAAYILDHLLNWRTFVDVLAVVIALAGLAIAIWGRVIFWTEGTEIMPDSETNAKLITYGPYSVTRNPIYLGMIVLTVGLALYAGTLPYFFVPVALYFILDRAFVPMEEAKMARQFGTVYADYRLRVKRWF